MEMRYYDRVRDEMRIKRRYVWAISGFMVGVFMGALLVTVL